MDAIVKSLDEHYQLIKTIYKDGVVVLFIESNQKVLLCPYCNVESTSIHSYQTREIQDLPIVDLKTVLIVSIRKMKCLNSKCSHKYFSEQLSFAQPRAQKTNRLIKRILHTSSEMSSVCSSKLLKDEKITVGKSTICNLIKKKHGNR